jgi:hypothetical protein
MPTWGEILVEINQTSQPGQVPNFDAVRRKYLTQLASHTKRSTILYASRFTQGDANAAPGQLMITDEDLHGFMEAVHALPGPNLDLILHSPGGSIDAAEAIVTYLRQKFTNIRVIVPQQAMSAAAMMSCAANSILMGKHSFLGPTDPQFIMGTPLGPRAVPAQAILEQWEKALKECQDRSKLPVYMPMLAQFGPDLLIQAENVDASSRRLVKEWLQQYMFAGEADASAKAEKISVWMSAHKDHGRHSRHIPRATAETQGLKIENLEDDQVLQDLVLSVYHATMIMFTSAVRVHKIIENNLGKAFVKMAGQIVFQGPPGGFPQGFPAFFQPPGFVAEPRG